MLNKNFQKWFNSQKKLNRIKIKTKKLNDLENEYKLIAGTKDETKKERNC